MNKTEQQKENTKLLLSCKEAAFNSVYWSRKALCYHMVDIYEIAPMVIDEVWASLLYKETDIVGVLEIEDKLGRKLKIEELSVCPLSVNYLICGEPIVTGTEEEHAKLIAFHELIVKGIQKNERRSIGYELKRLQSILDK